MWAAVCGPHGANESIYIYMAAVCALHSASINCFHTFVLRRTSSEPGALARTAVSVGRHLLARELVLLAVPRMDAEAAEAIHSPKNENYIVGKSKVSERRKRIRVQRIRVVVFIFSAFAES